MCEPGLSLSIRNGTFSIILCLCLRLCLCLSCESLSVNWAVHNHKRKHESFLVSGIHQKNKIQARSVS